MITKIDQETLNFLSKKKLTFNQFCMCLLILHKDVAGIIQYTDQVGFITGGTIIRPNQTKVNEFEDLVDRKFLKFDSVDKTNRYALDNYTVTDKFVKDFMDRYKTAAKVFFDEYPMHLFINGQEVPAKAVDYAEFEDQYIKHIESNFSIHDVIMEKLRLMKVEKKYAPMSILKFVSSRYYEGITSGNTVKNRYH